MKSTSQRGLDLVENAEGLHLRAYQDGVGVWTIGYGHTRGVRPGMVITAADAQAYLRSDLNAAERAVNTLVTVDINQNQFDALVDFTFNLGAGALAGSTLLRRLNDGDYDGAADEFGLWVHAGRKIELGLVKRRSAEKALFLRPQDTQSPAINWMTQLNKTQQRGASSNA
ncbi:lysozyme [Cernens ardua]|uniref:lysozyme n=1 Tax=Cernens ardua TaxID=3402176 RepID=UPI003F973371